MVMIINLEELPDSIGFNFKGFLRLGFEDFEPDCLNIDTSEDNSLFARRNYQ